MDTNEELGFPEDAIADLLDLMIVDTDKGDATDGTSKVKKRIDAPPSGRKKSQ